MQQQITSLLIGPAAHHAVMRPWTRRLLHLRREALPYQKCFHHFLDERGAGRVHDLRALDDLDDLHEASPQGTDEIANADWATNPVVPDSTVYRRTQHWVMNVAQHWQNLAVWLQQCGKNCAD